MAQKFRGTAARGGRSSGGGGVKKESQIPTVYNMLLSKPELAEAEEEEEEEA